MRDAGLEQLDSVDEYDLILALNDPLQYILKEAGRHEALQRMFRALKPGGRILVDIANFPYILAHRRPPRVTETVWEGIRTVRRPTHSFDEAVGI